MDKSKLVKLLNLTSSENDNEALSALRKANSILSRHGKRWDDLIKIEPDIPDWQKKYARPPSYETEIAEYKDKISYIRMSAWDGFNFVFVISLEDVLNEGRRLSQKQRAALDKIYAAVKKAQDKLYEDPPNPFA